MRTVRVSAAVIHDGSLIWAARRARGKAAGQWEFPGGKREKGESGEETVIREIKEELDSDISVEKFLFTISCGYPDFFLVMDCFLCRLEGGSLTLKEHDEARWLKPDELEELDWMPADAIAVRRLKDTWPPGCRNSERLR